MFSDSPKSQTRRFGKARCKSRAHFWRCHFQGPTLALNYHIIVQFSIHSARASLSLSLIAAERPRGPFFCAAVIEEPPQQKLCEKKIFSPNGDDDDDDMVRCEVREGRQRGKKAPRTQALLDEPSAI